MDLPHPTGTPQASQNASSLGHWSLQPLLYRHQLTDLPWALEQGQPSSILILCVCCSHWRGPGLAGHFPRTAAGLALYQQGSHQGKSREWGLFSYGKDGTSGTPHLSPGFPRSQSDFPALHGERNPSEGCSVGREESKRCLGAPVLCRAGLTLAVGGSQRALAQPPPGS